MKVLLATDNPAKIKYYETELNKNGIEVITIRELEKEIKVEENGKDAIENAKIKVETYYKEYKIPTIATDDTLFIEGLPDEQQPKTNVRRVNGKRLNDKEMLEYYRNIVHDLGGQAKAYWLHGIAICKKGKTSTYSKKTELILTEERSSIISEGYPLDSMTYLPEYNKFLSEITPEEREKRNHQKDNKNKKMIEFILKNIKDYKKIIFDLDDTLCDDYENIKHGFYTILKIKEEELTQDKLKRFLEIDKKYWKERAEGKIKNPYGVKNKKEIVTWHRAQRFLIYFENKISFEEAVKLNDIYMKALEENIVPIKGAYETIKYLYDKEYEIFIATNGVKSAIPSKLKKIGITHYIKEIVTAEEIGEPKPREKFLKGLVEKCKIQDKEEILFIGDEEEKDIKFGNTYHFDTCWFNPNNEKAVKYIPTYEIEKLERLKTIL